MAAGALPARGQSGEGWNDDVDGRVSGEKAKTAAERYHWSLAANPPRVVGSSPSPLVGGDHVFLRGPSLHSYTIHKSRKRKNVNTEPTNSSSMMYLHMPSANTFNISRGGDVQERRTRY